MKQRVVFIIVIILHYVWALCLLLDSNVQTITAIGELYFTFHLPNYILALIFGFVSTACLVCVIRNKSDWYDLIGLFIQQIMVSISTVGIIEAILTATYADGTQAPNITSITIFADQIIYILIFIFHTYAILANYNLFKWTRR